MVLYCTIIKIVTLDPGPLYPMKLYIFSLVPLDEHSKLNQNHRSLVTHQEDMEVHKSLKKPPIKPPGTGNGPGGPPGLGGPQPGPGPGPPGPGGLI